MPKDTLRIVYAAGVTIPDPGKVASLAIFYDKIYLPHPYDLDPNALNLVRWPGKYLDDLESAQLRYMAWKERWAPLFEAGVLEVLPSAFKSSSLELQNLHELLLREMQIANPFFSKSSIFSGSMALAMHALFAKTADVEYLERTADIRGTTHLRTVLEETLLRYRVPLIGDFPPDRLLKIRGEMAPDRASFSLYLNQLVDDVEGRLVATGGDDRAAALRTVERKIIPELEEYLRKERLRSNQSVVKLLKLISTGISAFIGIAMSPWDVKNYTGLSDLMLDGADVLIDSRLDKASTRHRAFQFISAVEKSAS